MAVVFSTPTEFLPVFDKEDGLADLLGPEYFIPIPSDAPYKEYFRYLHPWEVTDFPSEGPLDLRIEWPCDLTPDPIQQSIFNIIDPYLQPTCTASPADAAEELIKCCKESPESAFGFVWDLFNVFMGLSPQIPNDHPAQEKLVQLIAEFRDTKECPARPWSIIAKFKPCVAEVLWNVSSIELSSDPICHRRYLNTNSFCARLFRDGLYPAGWIGFGSILGYLSEGGSLNEIPYMLDASKLDIFVPFAAEWFFVAGEKLYAYCMSGDGGPVYESFEDLLKKWNGFKARFMATAGHHQVKKEVRLIAQRALDCMLSAEQAGTPRA